MLTIRLFRIGKKNQPSFKVVITDKQNPPRGGRFVEEVGFYNPVTKEKVLKQERLKYWISQGAQPSVTVHNLLVKEGILEDKKIPKHSKSKKEPVEVKEAPKEEKVTEVKPQSIGPPKEEIKEAEPQSVPLEEKKEEPSKKEGL